MAARGAFTVLSVRFEESVSLLLAPAGAHNFPPVENAGIQAAIRKRVPTGAQREPGLTESTAL